MKTIQLLSGLSLVLFPLLMIAQSSTYISGSYDFNTYRSPGLYELETAGGIFTNSPYGTATMSNFKVVSLGGFSRRAEIAMATASNSIWVRNAWDYGSGMNYTAWDRLALVSELGSNAFNSTAFLPLTGGTVTGYSVINNIHFSGTSDNYAGAALWQDQGLPHKTHLNGYSLSFGTGVNGNRVERLHIDNGGNVGIGSASFKGAVPKFGVKTDAADYVAQLEGSTTTGGSYGVRILAGTNNNDASFVVGNAANTTTYLVVKGNGSVGIGTTNVNDAAYQLFVEKGIRTRKVKVDQVRPWPDYVFEPTYKLPSLKEVEAFIKEHKHLPDVPSAQEVAQNGLDLGDNQAVLLKKIEEQMLYILELNKQLGAQAKTIEALQQRLEKLEK